MVRSLGATGRSGRSQTSAAQDNQRRVARGPAARCAGRRPVAVKMQSGGSATRRDGASGLERRPPVGTRCATAQRTARRRVAGWFSVGATGRRGRPRTSVARDDKRRATRGPSARCADRRSAFQAVCAFGMGGPTRSAALRAACRPEAGVPSRFRLRDGWFYALLSRDTHFYAVGWSAPTFTHPRFCVGEAFRVGEGRGGGAFGMGGPTRLRRYAPRAGRRPAFQAVCAFGMGSAACSAGGQ